MADRAVGLKQNLAESKVDRLWLVVILLLLDAVLVSIIIRVIKKYVRDQLETQAHLDPLTGVFNRTYFNMRAAQLAHAAQRYEKSLSFVLLDVDDFKKINDTYGHDVGDEVLVGRAQLVKSAIRQSDDFFRLGGEEFGVILPDTDKENGLGIAEKICDTVANAAGDSVDRVTISLGISQYHYGEQIADMFKRADKALYQAKREGKNRVSLGET